MEDYFFKLFCSSFSSIEEVHLWDCLQVIPRQVKAEKAVSVIRSSVEELIGKCKEIVEAEGERIDEEEYINDTDPSILRFLLASREEGLYMKLSQRQAKPTFATSATS